MALLLGIDLGTSYFKAGLFDERGTLHGLGRVAVDPSTPAPGRCELPVEMFWRRLRSALGQALAQAGVTAGAIAAISYSSQANTFLLLDQHDAPLTPLILWTDLRGGAVPEQLQTFMRSETFRRAVGFETISTESAVNKWLWLQVHEPALVARARSLMTISDYFTFVLTGERVGDASTAAMLGLYDLREHRWWPDAQLAFGLQQRILAQPLAPGAPCGRTTGRAAELLGVPAGIPFAVGGLDHHVAAIGAGLGRFADVSISTGTVLAATHLVDRVEPVPGCFHGPAIDGARYFRLCFDSNGARQLDEYRERFAPEETIERLIAMAAEVEPLQRPEAAPFSEAWGQDRRAAVRYVLEKIGFAHRALVRKVSGGRPVARVSATGGGARSAIWLGIKADILNLPIVSLACAECACLGAAVFAAAAAGIYPGTTEAVDAMVRPGRVYTPERRAAELYRRFAPCD